MKIELNSQERKILLDALMHKAYANKVNEPKTPFLVRQIYKALIGKIGMKEVEATKGKPEQAIKLLKKEINFINFNAPAMSEKQKQEAEKLILDYDRAITYLEEEL